MPNLRNTFKTDFVPNITRALGAIMAFFSLLFLIVGLVGKNQELITIMSVGFALGLVLYAFGHFTNPIDLDRL